MSINLKHEELGWLDEFATAALPAVINQWPGGDPATQARRIFEYALAAIERRRTILRENVL